MKEPSRLTNLLTVGSDRNIVLALAAATVVRGMSYLPGIIPTDHHIPALEAVAPTAWWAWVWIAAGAVVCLGVVAPRWASLAVGVTTAAHCLWGLLYLGSWIFGQSERGWVTALTYILTTYLIIAAFKRVDPTVLRRFVEGGDQDE